MLLWSFEGAAYARTCTPGQTLVRHGAFTISAVIATGSHLFPFRTEKLSPSAPMVLGLFRPGRVGRRRFFFAKGRREAAFRRFRPRAASTAIPDRDREG